MKRSVFILFTIIIMAYVVACDNNDTNFTSAEKLKSKFEENDYTVTEYNAIAEDIETTHLLAEKGDSYFDVCYGVEKEDIETVNNYYAENYSDYYKFNSNSDEGIVFCCSDEDAYKISGFKIVELDPIVVEVN